MPFVHRGPYPNLAARAKESGNTAAELLDETVGTWPAPLHLPNQLDLRLSLIHI